MTITFEIVQLKIKIDNLTNNMIKQNSFNITSTVPQMPHMSNSANANFANANSANANFANVNSANANANTKTSSNIENLRHHGQASLEMMHTKKMQTKIEMWSITRKPLNQN